MTLFDPLRKALLAGFGVQEKVKELIDELVEKGELSKSEGARLVKEWSQKADQSTSELNKTVADVISKTMEKMNLPTKDDINRLDKKVQTLSTRLKKLEEKKEG
jgi:polyhydroxyalkanoate synthesis regulator phasin